MPGQGPENPAKRRPLARPFAAPETRAEGLLPLRAAPFATPGASASRRTVAPPGLPTALFVEELERYLPPSAIDLASAGGIEGAPQAVPAAHVVEAASVMQESVRVEEREGVPVFEEDALEVGVPIQEHALVEEAHPDTQACSDTVAPPSDLVAAPHVDADVPAAPLPAVTGPVSDDAARANAKVPLASWPGLEVIAEREDWPIESSFDEDDSLAAEPLAAPGFDHGSGETFAIASTIHADGLDQLVASTAARDRALEVLGQLQARLKSGDLVIPADTGTSAESVLASILAALLLDRD